jgi:anti-anti-sigma regulatory factor
MALPGYLQSEWRPPAARVVRPSGALTATTILGLRRWVATQLSEGARRIVVDLSQVSSCDDSAVSGLLACERAARAAHAVLVISVDGCDERSRHGRTSDGSSHCQPSG